MKHQQKYKHQNVDTGINFEKIELIVCNHKSQCQTPTHIKCDLNLKCWCYID